MTRHRLSAIARDLFTSKHKAQCADVLRALKVLATCRPCDYQGGLEVKLSSDDGHWLCSVKHRGGKVIAIEIAATLGGAVMRLVAKLAAGVKTEVSCELGQSSSR